MKTIKLLNSVAGKNFKGKPFAYAAGEIVEVSERLAADLVKANYAESVKAAKPSTKRKTATSKAKKETR